MDYLTLSKRVNPNETRIDDGLNGWMLRYAHKNYWRVAHWYDLEDLIQDGYMVFARCEERYSEFNQKEFMALFKACYANHITDLANKRTSSITEVSFTDMLNGHSGGEGEADLSDEYILQQHLGGAEDDTAEILDLIRQAPWELKQLFEVMMTEDGMHRVLEAQWSYGNIRGTHNERLCRICGLDPEETDLVSEVKRYLQPGNRRKYLDNLAEACEVLGVNPRRFRWCEE